MGSQRSEVGKLSREQRWRLQHEMWQIANGGGIKDTEERTEDEKYSYGRSEKRGQGWKTGRRKTMKDRV